MLDEIHSSEEVFVFKLCLTYQISQIWISFENFDSA